MFVLVVCDQIWSFRRWEDATPKNICAVLLLLKKIGRAKNRPLGQIANEKERQNTYNNEMCMNAISW